MRSLTGKSLSHIHIQQTHKCTLAHTSAHTEIMVETHTYTRALHYAEIIGNEPGPEALCFFPSLSNRSYDNSRCVSKGVCVCVFVHALHSPFIPVPGNTSGCNKYDLNVQVVQCKRTSQALSSLSHSHSSTLPVLSTSTNTTANTTTAAAACGL